MLSVYFFLMATFLLSLNLVRPLGLAISDWLYFAALGLAAIETIFYERKRTICWIKNRFYWPALLILLGAVLSLIRTVNIRVAVVEIIQLLYAVTLYISLIWIMVGRGYLKTIVRVFIFSGLLTAGIALFDYFTGSRLGPQLSGRPDTELWYRYAGTLGHPNKFGYFLALTSILTLAEWGGVRRMLRYQILWAGALGIQIFALILSGSVNSYLGGGLGILIMLALSRKLQIKTIRIAIPAAVLGSLVLIVIALFNPNSFISSDDYENSVITLSLTRVREFTAQSRMTVFQQAVTDIFHSPLIGVGYDQAANSAITRESRLLDTTVHNVLLQNYYAGGLFSFLGWLGIYLYMGWAAIKTLSAMKEKPHLTVMSIAVCTLVIILMDQFQDVISQREKWLIVGLLVGIQWQLRFAQLSKNSLVSPLHARKGAYENSVLG